MNTGKISAAHLLLLLVPLFLPGGNFAAESSVQVSSSSPAPKNEDSAGFKEFNDRVANYVKLHKSIESSLPGVKTTDLPEMINAHQHALARKIREARPDAKIGDIFIPTARKSFENTIRATMQGPKGSNAQATMQQGAPLYATSVNVNEPYPDKIPYTTVPPTLLQAFPKLPDEVVYRVVGHDLVLLDLKANLVVDVFPGALP